MKDRIELSIVVLSYNNEPYVLECLKSIVRQGIESYEVYIIDDGSKDSSVAVINSYIEDKPNFHLIEKANEGGAIASQIGLEKCTGKYCAIIDSDDIVADNAYKKLISLIEENDADFAAGRPVRLQDSYKVGLLNDPIENNVFSKKRVLETEGERLELANTVFYWNSIYKREFIEDNCINMPDNLLIADRIFLFKAILKAKRIAVTSDVVYYWRKKGNEGALSLTDRQREVAMISDRIDSFEAQIVLHQECHNDSGEMTKKMLEQSLKRLFYPLYIPNNIEQHIYDNKWVDIYEMYRLFFMRYEAMFRHLSINSELDIKNKIIIELILKKQYKRLFRYLVNEIDESDLLPILSEDMKMEFQLYFEDCSFVRMVEEYDRVKACISLKNKKLKSVKAVNRFFEYNEEELEITDDEESFWIDNLRAGSYLLFACAEDDKGTVEYVNFGNKVQKDFNTSSSFIYENREYVFLSNASILNIYEAEKFILMSCDGDIYIKVNCTDKVRELVFFNTFDNTFYDIERLDNVTYKLSDEMLPEGRNVLFYKKYDGNYNYVTKYEIVNGDKNIEMYKTLFNKGFIEIKK